MAKRQRHTPEQIISKLREAEVKSAKGTALAQVCKDLAITEQTYYRWRKEYGGMKLDQARRLKQLEGENAKLNDTETEQKEELETLTRDNMELRAGARWHEWITGACLLAVGMLMGAIVQSMNGRRARPRIRL